MGYKLVFDCMGMKLNQEILKELLDYSPRLGVFFWKAGSHHGEVAGYIDERGYRKVTVCGKRYRAHRLVWLYVYGEWPKILDHINQNRADNRISNLREVTPSQNRCNSGIMSNNKSGFKGVSYAKGMKRIKRWRAEIRLNGNLIFLGMFKTKQEASEVYGIAAKKYHGEFARAA